MYKEIPNLSGYLVNQNGVVINQSTKKRLAQTDNGFGYKYVQLRDKKNRYVHRLVAAAFIPNPEGKAQVDHIDGDRSNNNVTNLRWVTATENHYAFGHDARSANRQRVVIAENIVTNQVVMFNSRNACARYFKCDKSKIKYGWVYKKGSKKDWLFTLDNR